MTTSSTAQGRTVRPTASRSASEPAPPLTARRWILDLSAAALLLAVPIVGFLPTFGGPWYLIAAVGGTLLGLAIAALGARFRWGTLVVAAITAAAYFLFGGALAMPQTALAGVVPTLDTLQGLALGAVQSFKEMLTTPVPVAASDGFLVVPLLTSLVAAVLVGSLGLRLRSPGWALIPAVLFLGLEIALGTTQPAWPVIQGAVFSAVAIGWLAIRRAWSVDAAAVSVGADGDAVRSGGGRRLVAGAAVVAVAIGAGVAVGALTKPPTTRYVLRDVVIPPFDLHQYASPLQSYRGYVRDYTNSDLFTVTGMPKGARVRIAAMDAYSGTVYNVSDSASGSSSAFIPIRSNMSGAVKGDVANVHVTIDKYQGVWLPGVEAARSITFSGPRADELRRTAYYNEFTQTAVDTTPLQKGDEYEMEVVVPSEHTDESLANAKFAPITMPKQQSVPQSFAADADKIVGGAQSPIEQVRALQKHFAERGYFSDGLGGQVRSLAGHGAGRISAMLGAQQMVGDDEQYAVAMALLARELGIPARVVMGFHPDAGAAPSGAFTANSSNLHAWVEVPFEGIGWVAFDPTPDKDKKPDQQETQPQPQSKPQILQPPPPVQQPADPPPAVPDDAGKKTKHNDVPAWIGTAITISVLVLAIAALLLAPFIVMGAIKGARRRRRKDAARPSDRISGGWDELVDRALDLGAPMPSGATRGEDAVSVGEAFEQTSVMTLAREADAQVFGPAEPTAADIERFWSEVDTIVGGMGAQRSFWRRLGARLSLRSLRNGRTPTAVTNATTETPGPKES